MSEGLFRSVDWALRFAFDGERRGAPRPFLNRVAAPSAGGDPGLAGLDGAAQAGMIRAEVKRLGEIPEAVLICRYAPRTVRCDCRRPCCRGSFENPEWRQAAGLLAEQALRPLKLGGGHHQLRFDIVRRYFCGGSNIQDLAKRHGLNRNTVGVHNSRIVREIRRIEGSAGATIESRLIDLGVLDGRD